MGRVTYSVASPIPAPITCACSWLPTYPILRFYHDSYSTIFPLASFFYGKIRFKTTILATSRCNNRFSIIRDPILSRFDQRRYGMGYFWNRWSKHLNQLVFALSYVKRVRPRYDFVFEEMNQTFWSWSLKDVILYQISLPIVIYTQSALMRLATAIPHPDPGSSSKPSFEGLELSNHGSMSSSLQSESRICHFKVDHQIWWRQMLWSLDDF